MRDSREIVTNAIDLIHEANADREPMIPPKQYKHVQAQSLLLAVIAREMIELRELMQSKQE